MLSETRKREEMVDSCRAISYFFGQFGNNLSDYDQSEIINLLNRDFCYKVSKINPYEKALIITETWYYQLPKQIRDFFTKDTLGLRDISELGQDQRKAHKDIGIITVIQPEKCAVLRALGKDDDSPEDDHSSGFDYWFSDIKREGKDSLEVVVTLVGEPRNVKCAIAVQHLLNDFNVDTLILVGIAAGTRGKVKLGDVVAATKIVDYEHKRLEIVKLLGDRLFKKLFFGLLDDDTILELQKMIPVPKILKTEYHRPESIKPPKTLITAISKFSSEKMRAVFSSTLTSVDNSKLPKKVSKEKISFSPSLYTGSIAAGEKLFSDGGVTEMYLKMDQTIHAADQEDSGFAQMCDYKKVPWCVFRGICDYGDPSKGDKWHYVSALAAASACVAFLKYDWRI